MARQGLCPIRIYQPNPTYYVGSVATLAANAIGAAVTIQPATTISIQLRYRYPKPVDRQFACFLVESSRLNQIKLDEISEADLYSLASVAQPGISHGSTDVLTTSQGNATWIIETSPLQNAKTVHYTMVIVDRASHVFVTDTLKLTSLATPADVFGFRAIGGQGSAYDEIKIAKLAYVAATQNGSRKISFDLQMSLSTGAFDVEIDAYNNNGNSLNIFLNNTIQSVDGSTTSSQSLEIVADYLGGEYVTVTATATSAQVTSDGVSVLIS